MNTELAIGLAAFAFASSITPGPNNLMLLASGARFGVPASLPHAFGVGLGFLFMLTVVGAGLGPVLTEQPEVLEPLRWLAAAIVCWLAWRMVGAVGLAATEGETKAGARPLRFHEAAAFQWINPKGWAMALGAVGGYLVEPGVASVLTVAIVFALVNLPCVALWLLAGGRLRRWLEVGDRARTFQRVMAALLVASTLPMVLEG